MASSQQNKSPPSQVSSPMDAAPHRKKFLETYANAVVNKEAYPPRTLDNWLQFIEKELHDPGECSVNVAGWAKDLGLSDPASVDTLYQVLTFVLDAIKQMDESQPVTVHNTAAAIYERLQVHMPPAPDSAHQAIFAIFGVLTMAYSWAPPSEMYSDEFNPRQSKHRQQDVQPIPTRSGARSEFGKELRKSGAFLPSRENDGILLSTGGLDAFTLYEIARIKIQFVDEIGSHLSFNSYRRELAIFAHPALCAIWSNPDWKPNYCSRILSGYFGEVDSDMSDPLRLISQEVLLSYRILFAATKRANEFFFEKLFPRLGSPATVDIWRRILSPKRSREVKALPSHYWPDPVRDMDGVFIEESLYDASSDFIFFGQRLGGVQDFFNKQNPRKLRAMWYDRRNKAQWVTYWTALAIGGASVFFSLIQTILAFMQVFYKSDDTENSKNK